MTVCDCFSRFSFLFLAPPAFFFSLHFSYAFLPLLRRISIACNESETTPTSRSYRNVYDTWLRLLAFSISQQSRNKRHLSGEHCSRWIIHMWSEGATSSCPLWILFFYSYFFCLRVDLRYTSTSDRSLDPLHLFTPYLFLFSFFARQPEPENRTQTVLRIMTTNNHDTWYAMNCLFSFFLLFAYSFLFLPLPPLLPFLSEQFFPSGLCEDLTMNEDLIWFVGGC